MYTSTIITENQYLEAVKTIKKYFAQQHKLTLKLAKEEAINEFENDSIIDAEPVFIKTQSTFINLIKETNVRVGNCLVRYFKDKGIDMNWDDLVNFNTDNFNLINIDEIKRSKNFGKHSEITLIDLLNKQI
jgi:hypothetical protein